MSDADIIRMLTQTLRQVRNSIRHKGCVTPDVQELVNQAIRAGEACSGDVPITDEEQTK